MLEMLQDFQVLFGTICIFILIAIPKLFTPKLVVDMCVSCCVLNSAACRCLTDVNISGVHIV